MKLRDLHVSRSVAVVEAYMYSGLRNKQRIHNFDEETSSSGATRKIAKVMTTSGEDMNYIKTYAGLCPVIVLLPVIADLPVLLPCSK